MAAAMIATDMSVLIQEWLHHLHSSCVKGASHINFCDHAEKVDHSQLARESHAWCSPWAAGLCNSVLQHTSSGPGQQHLLASSFQPNQPVLHMLIRQVPSCEFVEVSLHLLKL